MNCQAVRPLTLQDLPAAHALSSAAGWNQTAEDWRMLLELGSAECLGLDMNGQLAATTSLVSYGTQLGWIGMVLTDARFRRRGCARILLQHVMELAVRRGLKTIKLDATDMGAPLYAALGFRFEQTVERWSGEISGSPALRDEAPLSLALEQLDLRSFGADRSALLRSLIRYGSLTASREAFALTRAGRIAQYVGPCVAANPESARHIIREAISAGGNWYWDLLPGNSAAVEVAETLGFAPVRRLQRMWWGMEDEAQEDTLYALAGFEFG